MKMDFNSERILELTGKSDINHFHLKDGSLLNFRLIRRH